MGSYEANIDQTRRQVADSAGSALISEIESIVLSRMQNAGGRLAEVARFRSFMGEALGVYGTVRDIVDMAIAGFEAMNTQERMLMRVSAAHGFGYWVFQHLNIPSPLNPPNSFLIFHRQNDRSDQSVGHRIGNSDYSTDGGLTSVHWNSTWRRGVQDCISTQEARMHNQVHTGIIQRALEQRLDPQRQSNVVIHGQGYEALASQYRAVFLAPKYGSPSVAAGAFFLSSLQNATRQDKVPNLRLYQQFPYNPR